VHGIAISVGITKTLCVASVPVPLAMAGGCQWRNCRNCIRVSASVCWLMQVHGQWSEGERRVGKTMTGTERSDWLAWFFRGGRETEHLMYCC